MFAKWKIEHNENEMIASNKRKLIIFTLGMGESCYVLKEIVESGGAVNL